jgi:hypothetical protein
MLDYNYLKNAQLERKNELREISSLEELIIIRKLEMGGGRMVRLV